MPPSFYSYKQIISVIATAFVVYLYIFVVYLYSSQPLTATPSLFFQTTRSTPAPTASIDDVNMNWLPYYLRCDKPKSTNYGANGIRSGFSSKHLVYSHVFKSGGTTIAQGIRALIRANKMNGIQELKYKKSISDLKPFLDNNTFIFTFVRDPITRFLGSFFEVNRRAFSEANNFGYMSGRIKKSLHVNSLHEYSKMNSTQVLKAFINKLLHSQSFFDEHLAPNTFFLNDSLPFNYIGNLRNLDQDLPKILAPFITDDELKNDHQLLMNTYFQRQRSRFTQNNSFSTFGLEHFSQHEMTVFFKKYALDMTQLDDEMIRNLCEIYWIDYTCFPFKIPSQCIKAVPA
eukprot:27637_1